MSASRENLIRMFAHEPEAVKLRSLVVDLVQPRFAAEQPLRFVVTFLVCT